MVYREYNDWREERESERRENRSRNTKRAIEKRIPGRVSKRLETTRHKPLSVSAGPILITLRPERHNKGDGTTLPCSGAL